MPALQESKEAQSKLDNLLIGCFAVQKMYGRAPENIEAINQVFHTILGKYNANKVLKAFEIWIERSQEFPTPADIVNLIKRGGRAPITREVYISISRKDGEDRTPAEWQTMREYESQQIDEEFGMDEPDEYKLSDLRESNETLRKQLREEQEKNDRLSEKLKAIRMAKGLERPKPALDEKIKRTIEEMRRIGASENDIESFAAPYGGLYALESLPA